MLFLFENVQNLLDTENQEPLKYFLDHDERCQKFENSSNAVQHTEFSTLFLCVLFEGLPLK